MDSSKPILVTGGAGFIGSHLCENLIHDDIPVVCLDNFDEFYDPVLKERNLAELRNSPLFRLVRGDIRDEGLLEQLFSTERFQAVVHLAARAGVRPSIEAPLLYVDVNVVGTMKILEAMRRHGVKRGIIASSSSVYGNNRKVPFSETDPVDHPVSPYAATKKAVELLAHTYSHLHGLKLALVRFFTVYGPRQRPEMAIHKFTRLMDEGRELPFFGDGTSSRDYTYVADIISGIRGILQADFKYDVINLGESRTTTLSRLVELISSALGKPARLNRLPLQPGDVQTTFADISRARAIYDYNPQTQIEEGIRKFIAWYQAQKS